MTAKGLQQSWEANAGLWTTAVRNGTIESRRLATDSAVLAAIQRLAPRRVLDLGCGEGWLVRKLADKSIETLGIDGSKPLIAEAQRLGGGSFLLLDFAAFAAAPERVGGPFDCVVANFALLEEALRPTLEACAHLLAPGGRLIIQSLHPWTQPAPYRDGWRQEDFTAMSTDGWRAMPWYFRTLGSWVALLQESGFLLTRLEEPRHPISGQPLSLLLEAGPSDRLLAEPSCTTSRQSR